MVMPDRSLTAVTFPDRSTADPTASGPSHSKR